MNKVAIDRKAEEAVDDEETILPHSSVMAHDDESTCSTHTACANTSNSDNQDKTKTNNHKKARKWPCAFLVVGAIAAAIGIVTTVVMLTRRTSTNSSSGTNSSTSSSSNTNSSYNESTSIFDMEDPNEDFVFVEPFEVRPLVPFDQRVLQPYNTREELEEDLENFAKILVNRWIAESLDYRVWPDQQEATAASARASAKAEGATAQTNYATQQQQHSLTNNQEKNADEADIVKNDDLYVYAASGSHLAVWDRRRGRMVAQDRMPRHTYQQYYVSSFASIKAIQLTKNHVVVVAGAIGNGDYTFNSSVVQRNNYQVRVYTKPKYNPAYDQANVTTATLPLVSTKLLHGYYIASHYLEASDSVHITMGSQIDTLYLHGYFTTSLSAMGQTLGSKALYVQEATKAAKEWLIPNFVQGIADDFWSPSGSFMRMSSFLPSSESGMDDLWRIGGYVQVTSFLAKDLPVEEGSLTTLTTSLLTPSDMSYSYAVDNSMVIAVYHWHQEYERMALIHLKVDANTSTAHFFSLASLEGQLPQWLRAVDLLGNDLRVAVTEDKWSTYNVAMEECGWMNDRTIRDNPCVNETNRQQCFDLVNTEYCKTLLKTGCPYEFVCDEDEITSTTNNYVVVLDTTQPGEMVERGRVHIGEPHQRITAVHFGETSAYIATQNKRSTFYTLKLDVGGVPEVKGSLHGLERVFFYLFPLNEQATRLLGLGHKAVGSGQSEMWTGLVVSILDVSNQTDSVLVADNLIEGVKGISRYDLKPVQYKDGILVLPVLESATDTGMIVVFRVQEEGVSELFRRNIGQRAPQNGCSSCWSSLPVRSLFFDDGTLMSMSQNTVVSMDAASGEELWSFDVVFNGTGNCCQK